MRKKVTAPASGEQLLTASDVGAVLRLSRAIVYGKLRHDLPWLQIGGALRMRRRDLEHWLDGHRQAA